MFNFLKSKKKEVQVVQPTKTTAELVAEIHDEFLTAGEKLLSQANETLLSVKSTHNIDKSARLVKLGFKNAAGVKEGRQQAATTELSKWLSSLIMDYATRYPNQRFINDFQVKRICKKYNLVCATVDRYTGVVPDKKLAEIEDFRILNYRDLPENMIRVKEFKNPDHQHIKRFRELYPDLTVPDRSEFFSEHMAYVYCYEDDGRQHVIGTKSVEKINLRDTTLICAPASDLNLEGLSQHKGMYLETKIVATPDPVVLKPVNGGYLILAAWGPEASDEDVVNHKLN